MNRDLACAALEEQGFEHVETLTSDYYTVLIFERDGAYWLGLMTADSDQVTVCKPCKGVGG